MTNFIPDFPWSEDELRRVIRNGLKEGVKKPLRISPPPFSTDEQFAEIIRMVEAQGGAGGTEPVEPIEPKKGPATIASRTEPDPVLSAIADVMASAAEKVDPGISTRVSTRSTGGGPYPRGEPPLPLTREIAAATAYPVAALGLVLAPAAEAIAGLAQAPVALAGQSVLLAGNLITAGVANVRTPHAVLGSTSLYALTIALTGERKTTVDRYALKPVKDRVALDVDVYTERFVEYQRDKAIHERMSNALVRSLNAKSTPQQHRDVRDAIDRLGKPPEPPLMPQRTNPEPTIEGLTKFFIEAYPSHGVFSSEAAQFLNGHAMSADTRIRTFGFLSGIWDGEALSRIRAGEPFAFIPGKRLALHLFAQPSVAASLLNDKNAASQGFLSRVLAAAPPSLIGHRPFREPRASDQEGYTFYLKYMTQLLEVNPYIKPGTRNELQPSIIEMSDGAQSLWIDFHDENEADLAGPENVLPRELWNKAAEQAARIAGTIALVRGLRACPDEGNLPFNIPTIAPEEMRGAIELTRYYRAEIVRLVEAGSVSQSVDTAQRLLDWFKARSPGEVDFTSRDLSDRPPATSLGFSRPARGQNTPRPRVHSAIVPTRQVQKIRYARSLLFTY